MKIDLIMLMFIMLLRMVVSCVILYASSMPIYVKIIALILVDALDGGFLHIWHHDLRWDRSLRDSKHYQIADKIVDTIVAIMIYIYALDPYTRWTGALLLYRIVGVVLFILFQNRTFLVIFPNFFRFAILWITIQRSHPQLYKYGIFGFTIGSILTVVNEINLHLMKIV